jgi:hypothetical protein
MKTNVWRGVIEVGFIIFLFYSNLLMGEYERSGLGQKRGVAWHSKMSSPLPILKLPRSPRSAVISCSNFFERDSRQTNAARIFDRKRNSNNPPAMIAPLLPGA